jgi:hypothetical protein
MRAVTQAVLERCPRDWAAESLFQRFVDARDVHRPFRLQQQLLSENVVLAIGVSFLHGVDLNRSV